MAKPHITYVSLYARHPRVKESWRYAIVVDTKLVKRIEDENGAWQKVLAPTHKRTEDIFQKQAFKGVYKNEVADDSFRNEWILQIRPYGTSVSRITDETKSEILYPRNKKTDREISAPKFLKMDGTESDIVEQKIRGLRFWEEDGAIIIQQPGKKSSNVGVMGFKTKTKEWKEFIKAISNPPHFFKIGRKSEGQYENRRSYLRAIDGKLIALLQKELSINIPKGFKTFELVKGEEAGTYRFKFQICKKPEQDPYEEQFQELDKDTLINTITDLKKSLDTCNDREDNRYIFMLALTVAIKRKILSKDEINKRFGEMLQTPQIQNTKDQSGKWSQKDPDVKTLADLEISDSDSDDKAQSVGYRVFKPRD